MPFAPSYLLPVRPGAPSSVLAPNCLQHLSYAFSSLWAMVRVGFRLHPSKNETFNSEHIECSRLSHFRAIKTSLKRPLATTASKKCLIYFLFLPYLILVPKVDVSGIFAGEWQTVYMFGLLCCRCSSCCCSSCCCCSVHAQ